MATAIPRFSFSGSVPRGFPKDHAAAEYLRFRQFLAGKEFPPTLAASPVFYARLLDVFRRIAPLVRFLNEPLLGAHGRAAQARPGARDLSTN
jgi:hypothetical protein